MILFKKSALFFLVIVGALSVVTPFSVLAQDNTAPTPTPTEFFTAKVVKILAKGDPLAIKMSDIVQQLRVTALDGSDKGQDLTVQNSVPTNNATAFPLKTGDIVVVAKQSDPSGLSYGVVDLYRNHAMLWIIAFFIILVIALGRIKGFTSLIGLAFSILVLARFVVPRILAGHDPLTECLLGALMIIIVSLYLAHGFNKRTSLAMISSLLTLGLSAGMAVAFVGFAHLFGTGSEDALYLQQGVTEAINLKGLLLGGIIIGTLGVLDDVTTAQAATVEELHKANSSLHFGELYHRALSVGREHIVSLVNSLALAYAGVALPLFLLLHMNTAEPLWVALNGADIAEELVRTLVGSSTLVLAVPISTLIAAWFYGRSVVSKKTI